MQLAPISYAGPGRPPSVIQGPESRSPEQADDSSTKSLRSSLVGCFAGASCLAIVAGVVCIILFGLNISKYKYKVTRAAEWERAGTWKTVSCKVLIAGVACTEKDTGGTCGGYRHGGIHVSQPPYVFKTQDIAVCPGTYWCAKEEEHCKCAGDITYAARIFNGAADDPYNVDKARDPNFTIQSDGTATLCGHLPNGPFPSDPTPGWTKHCWCTPRAIKQLVGNGSTPIRNESCAKLSNADFVNFDQGGGAQMSRRLKGDDRRRRRTFSYTPWALLEVDLDDLKTDDVFSSPSPSPSGKQAVCAYEFGNTLASYEDYQSDGSYDGDVWIVEDLISKWSHSGDGECYVRTGGDAADSGRACATAMNVPGSLGEKRIQNLETYEQWFWRSVILLIVGCVGLGLFCFFECKAAKEREEDKEPLTQGGQE